MDKPQQRHSWCCEVRCETCLEDAKNLEKYIMHKIGTNNQKIDWLARYREWLDEKNITAENEHGWPHENVYKENNIDAFVKSYIE